MRLQIGKEHSTGSLLTNRNVQAGGGVFRSQAQSIPDGQTNMKTVIILFRQNRVIRLSANTRHLERLRNSHESRALILMGVVPSSIRAYIFVRRIYPYHLEL